MSISEVKFSRTWFQSTVEKGEWEKHLKDVPEFDISKNWNDTLRKAEIKRSAKKISEHTNLSKHTNILKRDMYNGFVLHKNMTFTLWKQKWWPQWLGGYIHLVCTCQKREMFMEDLVTVLQGKCMIYSVLLSIYFNDTYL